MSGSGATLRRPTEPASAGVAQDVKPVMLLTMDVPFDRVAVEFAVETSVETGAELYICDAVPIALGNPAVVAARSFGERETRDDVDDVTRYARSLGVRVTQFVFHNPRPVQAALEVIKDKGVGLVVFGADRKRLGRWSFRRTARKIRRDAACLVWTNE